MASVLVVDDEQSVRAVLELLFFRAGYDVATASGYEDAIGLLEHQPYDLIVTDYQLKGKTGLDLLKVALRRSQHPEVIVLTAYGTPESAVTAMRQGAYDYTTKPFNNDELLLLAERAIEKRRLAIEKRSLSASVTLRPLIGNSQPMRELWTLIEKMAPARATVLITGESGTGKEIVARALHHLGPKSSSPFLPVNCGALAEGVLESELFGHMKGAFTGAVHDHTGLLVAARDGTVLLDEIGELTPGTQVKLLRVLQERAVRPVGGTKEIPFEARVLATTNRDLEAEVRTGRFRQDLLFRLNILTIALPPLRARREDIALLARFFLANSSAELGRPRLSFTEETMRLLAAYDFPGNVRQLQNIVARAATLSDSDSLGPESLPAAVRGEPDFAPDAPPEIPPDFSLERYLDDLEHRYLLEALDRARGVKTRAAELLGLSFRSLRYRLAKFALSDREEQTQKEQP